MTNLVRMTNYARAELADAEDKVVVEKVLVNALLEFAKSQTPGYETLWDEMWFQFRAGHETAALGDGKFLEMLIKLIELLLPILLKLFFPTP